MSSIIFKKTINEYRKRVEENTQIKLARNATIHSKVTDLAIDWETFRKIDHTFSNVISGQMKVTNQKSSGRCWGFAGLNLFRIFLGRKYNLKHFEFSQNYFMFWDKFEKANYFLENIILTIDKPRDGRLLMYLLSNPIQDGGQWHMFINLINKYGVLPKTEMPESYQSSNSALMNRTITRKLRENAMDLRKAHRKGTSLKELRLMKIKMLEIIYQLLVIHLGSPPEKFNWQVRDKDEKFHRFDRVTPRSFFLEHVGLNLDEYACLINCPMTDKNYNEVYTVEYLGNVCGGKNIRYLNLPSNRLKETAIASIKDNNPVWFGCDVGKHFHRTLGVMDMELFDFDLFYSTDFPMTKADRLEYGESKMTHAMLFTGVDLNKSGNPKKWRVENSWGEKHGDKGFDIMNDNWFDEYNYEVVVPIKYLTDQEVINYNRDPVKLPPWDPMGALAI